MNAETCTECDSEMPKCKLQSHVCTEELSRRINSESEELGLLRKLEGFFEVTCSANHPMQRCQGQDFVVEQLVCEHCHRKDMALHSFYFKCVACDSVLCKACAAIQAKILPKSGTFSVLTNKELTYSSQSGSHAWQCLSSKNGQTCVSSESGLLPPAEPKWKNHKTRCCMGCLLVRGLSKREQLGSIFGQTYVQGNKYGLASYRFEPFSDKFPFNKGSHIIYENIPANWRLSNGFAPPQKKYFQDQVWIPECRTFKGTIDWSPNTFGHSAKWRYVMIFSRDLKTIEGGFCQRFDEQDRFKGTDHFGQELRYTLMEQQ